MSSLRDRLVQSGFEEWSGKRTYEEDCGLNSFDVAAILNAVLCVWGKGFVEYELMLMD